MVTIGFESASPSLNFTPIWAGVTPKVVDLATLDRYHVTSAACHSAVNYRRLTGAGETYNFGVVE